MLQIHPHQMQAFEAVTMSRFRQRIARMLVLVRGDLAARTDPGAIARFCDKQIRDAGTIGFTTELEVGIFCAVTLVHGLDWHLDQRRPMYAIARRDGVSAAHRAANLRNALLGPKAWRARRPRPAPWPPVATGQGPQVQR